ncbi:MAG: DUF6356 family protein [Casimicrobiaceae bacterium]
MNVFTAHPASVNETYWQHLRFALRFGTLMTLGGLAALVHALLPFCFVTTAGRISDELVAMRAAARARNVDVERPTMARPDHTA